MTLIVFIMWWLVAVPTVRGFLRGTLFESPCLSSLPEDYARKIVGRQRDVRLEKAYRLGSNNDGILGQNAVQV